MIYFLKIELYFLQHSIELFKAAQQRSGRPTFFQDFLTKATRNLTEAKKDNDFIYHERIPDVKSLEPLGKAALAKISSLTHPLSQNFKGINYLVILNELKFKYFVYFRLI